MGIIKAGCFYVPLNDTYPQERLKDIIIDSGMQRLVTTRNLLKDVEGLVPDVHIYLYNETDNDNDNESLRPLTFDLRHSTCQLSIIGGQWPLPFALSLYSCG